MTNRVAGTSVWHINADEPDILDYDMTFKQDAQDALYEPDAYRSSDHDPVIVGLNTDVYSIWMPLVLNSYVPQSRGMQQPPVVFCSWPVGLNAQGQCKANGLQMMRPYITSAIRAAAPWPAWVTRAGCIKLRSRTHPEG
jgi:hypothetical protein